MKVPLPPVGRQEIRRDREKSGNPKKGTSNPKKGWAQFPLFLKGEDKQYLGFGYGSTQKRPRDQEDSRRAT